jgi:1-acyl-sn-glycerol-3-phosphate acyltransferase
MVWWSGWAIICGGMFSPLFRWRLRGWEKVPRDGNFFLLSNHTSAFDPVWISWPIARRCNYMASSALFRIPVLGSVISAYGAFPKAKFVKDAQSMKTLMKLFKNDEIIVMFPEGERTWDGRTREVLPGIGRLVKKLDSRVVAGRILTGHMFHPRWAAYPRWVPIRVEHELLEFPPDATVEQINAAITRAITIDVDSIKAPPLSFGFRLAEGLPDYLWACPQCHSLRSLRVPRRDRNAVQCSSCSSRWKLDVSCRMHGTTETSVYRAHDLITGHFGERPRMGDEVLVSENEGQIALIPRGSKEPPKVLAAGLVRLTEDALHVGTWSVPLAELRAVSVEIRNELWIYRGDQRLRLEPGSDSTLLWAHFLKKWLSSQPDRVTAR